MGLVTSQDTKDLFAAFVVAQSKVKGAVKESENPGFARGGKASKYADLASVRDACQEALASHGLGVIQSPSTEYEGDIIKVCITTRIVHSSGQWIEGCVSARPVTGLPQAVGSAITYLRRYALASMVGVAPEDDDGNAGSGVQAETKTKTTQKTSPREVDPQIERKALLEGLARDWAGLSEADIEAVHMLVIHRSRPADQASYSLDELRKLKSAKQTKASTPSDSENVPASEDQRKAIAEHKARVTPQTWQAVLTGVMDTIPESDMTEAQAEMMVERLSQEPDSELPGTDAKGNPVKWILCPKNCGSSVYWGKTAKGSNATFGQDGKLHLFTCPNAGQKESKSQ